MYWPFLHCFCHLLAEMFGNLQSGNNEISVAQSVSIHFFRWCRSARSSQCTNHFCIFSACTRWNLGLTSILNGRIFVDLQRVSIDSSRWCSSARPRQSTNHFCTSLACTWWNVGRLSIPEQQISMNLQYVRTLDPFWCSSVRPSILIHYFGHVLGNVVDDYRTNFNFSSTKCVWIFRGYVPSFTVGAAQYDHAY